jgi:hypothetical protein
LSEQERRNGEKGDGRRVVARDPALAFATAPPLHQRATPSAGALPAGRDPRRLVRAARVLPGALPCPAGLRARGRAPGTARVRFGDGLSGTPATPLPLDGFVAHLLRGRVRFEPEHVLCPLDSIIAVTAPDQCRRCAAPFEHVVGVTNIAFGPARFRIDGASIVALRDLWRGDRRQAYAVIRGLGRLRLHSALGHRSPIDYEREHAQTPVLAA